ncbi:MAG: radical SAM protein [bacterium]
MVNLEQKKINYPVTSGSLVIKENAYNLGKFWINDLLSHKSGFANEDLVNLLLLCDGVRKSQEIINFITSIYNESEDRINKKVKDSFQYLQQLGYIKFVDRPMHQPITFHRKCTEWSLDIVYLEVTDLCNLSCLYCYAETNSKARRKLKTGDIFNLIDDLANLGVLKIIFTGGEPLLHENIFEILRYTKSKKIDFSLFTNGTLLNEDTVLRLKDLNPQSIAVSLDSNHAEIHDMTRGKKCYSNVVKGIDLLNREGIPIRINSTILKGINDKTSDIEDAISFFMHKGANAIVIGPVMAYGKGRKNTHLVLPPSKMEQIASIFQRKAEEYKWKRDKDEMHSLKFSDTFNTNKVIPHSTCGVGTFACYIRTTGDVIPCPLFRDMNYCAGNVKEKKLDKIWSHSSIFESFRMNTVEDIPECQDCSAKLNCLGGCKARVLMYDRKFDSPDLWACSTMQGLGIR